MMHEVDSTVDPDATALAAYLEACECSDTISQSEWLARHPALARFLDDSDGVAAGLTAFRHGVREPDLNRPEERVLGDYELLEKVGGHMAAVYRARQVSLPREVGVKVLLRAGHADRDQFAAEAQALARLRHANIVPVYEVIRAAGTPAFSMEWCPKGALSSRVASYVAKPDRAAELVEVLALAIHHAHERGLLHRDLKPSNILFDEADQPRVADFGLVRPIQPEGSWCGVAGTPAYMAPEQLGGEATIRTDVYGLGAVLYELLTGRPPAKGDGFTAVLECVRAGDFPPPATINPQVSPDLDAICRKCLARNPAERYSSAAALAADLVRYRQGRATEARPLGLLGRIGHQLRQTRSAADFRGLVPGLYIAAIATLVCDWSVYFLLRYQAAEPWVWLVLFASYGPLLAAFARDCRKNRRKFHTGRLLLWSLWAGHVVACATTLVAFRSLAGTDLSRGMEAGFIACAGINVLAFAAFGAIVGRLYFAAGAWAIAAIGMAFAPSAGPLIYGVLMAACGLASGLLLKALATDDAN